MHSITQSLQGNSKMYQYTWLFWMQLSRWLPIGKNLFVLCFRTHRIIFQLVFKGLKRCKLIPFRIELEKSVMTSMNVKKWSQFANMVLVWTMKAVFSAIVMRDFPWLNPEKPVLIPMSVWALEYVGMELVSILLELLGKKH